MLCFLWVFLEIYINCNSLTEIYEACSRVFPSQVKGPWYNHRPWPHFKNPSQIHWNSYILLAAKLGGSSECCSAYFHAYSAGVHLFFSSCFTGDRFFCNWGEQPSLLSSEECGLQMHMAVPLLHRKHDINIRTGYYTALCNTTPFRSKGTFLSCQLASTPLCRKNSSYSSNIKSMLMW